MQTHSSLIQLRLPGCALTIGNFDGLHLGHRALIEKLKESAAARKLPSVVMTFDPHPSRILRPSEPVPELFSKQDLVRELTNLMVDHLVIEPFTKELAQTTAPDFVRQLTQHLGVQVLWIGHDFKFGKGREGQWQSLQQLGQEHGFQVDRLPPFLVHGEVVSSSAIRNALSEGQVASAAFMLGRNYYLEGQVISGEGRGESLGVKTANIELKSGLTPKKGVYLTWLHVEGQRYASISNLGHKPTFHEAHALTIECHVLQGEFNFYQKSVRLEFIDRVRDELKFPSSRELIKQIHNDILIAKRHFGL